jgi:hypothetical protein
VISNTPLELAASATSSPRSTSACPASTRSLAAILSASTSSGVCGRRERSFAARASLSSACRLDTSHGESADKRAEPAFHVFTAALAQDHTPDFGDTASYGRGIVAEQSAHPIITASPPVTVGDSPATGRSNPCRPNSLG